MHHHLVRLLTVVLVAMAAAASVAWIDGGAMLPAVSSEAVQASPMARLLAYTQANSPGPVAAVIAWSFAVNVALACVCALLLVLRSRGRPEALTVALSLALSAAGAALMFQLLALPPLPDWVHRTWPQLSEPLSAWPIVDWAIAAAGCGLLTAGLGLQRRYWLEHPRRVDEQSLRAFLAAHLVRTQALLAGYPSHGARLVGRAATAPLAHVAGWFPERSAVGAWGRAYWASEARDAVVTPAMEAKLRDAADRQAVRLMAPGFVRRHVPWAIVMSLSWAIATSLSRPMDGTSATEMAFALPLCIFLGGLAVLFRAIGQLVQYQTDLADPVQRRRLEWVDAATTYATFLFADMFYLSAVAGIVVGLPLYLIGSEDAAQLISKFGGLVPWLVMLVAVPGLAVAALAVSMLARGLVDPRLALRRLTVWTVLGLLLAFVFVLVERVVALRLSTWLGLDPQTGALAAGAAVAATALPMRRTVERWVIHVIEQRMPRPWLDASTRSTGPVALVGIAGFAELAASEEALALQASKLLQRHAADAARGASARVGRAGMGQVLLFFDDAVPARDTLCELIASFAAAGPAADRDAGRVDRVRSAVTLHGAVDHGEYLATADGEAVGPAVTVVTALAHLAGPGEVVASEAFFRALGGRAPESLAGVDGLPGVVGPVAWHRLI